MTISVRRQPYFITVDPTGHRAYIANSGSNSVSIVDLDRRREVSVAGAGEQPVQTHISPDGRTLVVTNHGSGSVSLFDVIRIRFRYAVCWNVHPPPFDIFGLSRSHGYCDSARFLKGVRGLLCRTPGDGDKSCGSTWIVGR